jgi:hypothetical protein
MKKMYISGQITGIEQEAPGLFKKAEEEVRLLGYEPVNPVTIPHEHDKTWQSYMREDVKAMCSCEAIYMLNNWTNSKGARIELRIAKELGLEVHHQSKIGKLTERMDESFDKIDLLTRYSRSLESHGYIDTDWRQERPTAIDNFLKDEMEIRR